MLYIIVSIIIVQLLEYIHGENSSLLLPKTQHTQRQGCQTCHNTDAIIPLYTSINALTIYLQ